MVGPLCGRSGSVCRADPTIALSFLVIEESRKPTKPKLPSEENCVNWMLSVSSPAPPACRKFFPEVLP